MSKALSTPAMVMHTAHAIRNRAALVQRCHPASIHWGECVRAAWAEIKNDRPDSYMDGRRSIYVVPNYQIHTGVLCRSEVVSYDANGEMLNRRFTSGGTEYALESEVTGI